MQVLGPGDAFAIQLRISVVIGIILAMPVLLYQVWAFVSPGLTAAERKTVRPWIPLALLFFALGVTVAYLILPYALDLPDRASRTRRWSPTSRPGRTSTSSRRCSSSSA